MARAPATRARTSALPSAGGGRMRSAAVTAGTSICRSIRSSSGPDSRVWYSAAQRVLGAPAGEAWLIERDFTRARVQAPADQRRHAGGMVRRAEPAAAGERAPL